jgi:hypothetical protein
MSVFTTYIFAPKVLNFRDKYYSRFTKLYYFGIYVKQFTSKFTMHICISPAVSMCILLDASVNTE